MINSMLPRFFIVDKWNWILEHHSWLIVKNCCTWPWSWTSQLSYGCEPTKLQFCLNFAILTYMKIIPIYIPVLEHMSCLVHIFWPFALALVNIEWADYAWPIQHLVSRRCLLDSDIVPGSNPVFCWLNCFSKIFSIYLQSTSRLRRVS